MRRTRISRRASNTASCEKRLGRPGGPHFLKLANVGASHGWPAVEGKRQPPTSGSFFCLMAVRKGGGNPAWSSSADPIACERCRRKQEQSSGLGPQRPRAGASNHRDSRAESDQERQGDSAI